MYGSYVPGAWFVGGLGDHLLLMVFHIFERWREHPEHDFADAVEQELSPRDWGDQAYLKGHVALVARGIYEEMHKGGDGETPPDVPVVAEGRE